MQPSPKCPYGMPVTSIVVHQRLEFAQVATQIGAAAPRRPPSPATPASLPGYGPARPAPSARICHSAVATGPAGSTIDVQGPGIRGPARRKTACASTRDLRRRSRPSTSRRHGAGRAPAERPGAPRTTSTSLASSPSTARGAWVEHAREPHPRPRPCPGSPSTTSIRAGLIGTSRTVASVTTPSVPSLPTSALVRLRPFSGSRCSREYPDTWRGNLPNSVRMTARCASTKLVQTRNLLPAIGCADPPAGAVDDGQRQHVVGGAAVGDRVRAAGVVADHAADARPVLAGRVRPEPEARTAPTRACRSDRMTPGSTTAVRLPGSTSTIRLRCRAKSMTMPVPMALPAIDVPPPRLVTGTPVCRLSPAWPARRRYPPARRQPLAAPGNCRRRRSTPHADAARRTRSPGRPGGVARRRSPRSRPRPSAVSPLGSQPGWCRVTLTGCPDASPAAADRAGVAPPGRRWLVSSLPTRSSPDAGRRRPAADRPRGTVGASARQLAGADRMLGEHGELDVGPLRSTAQKLECGVCGQVRAGASAFPGPARSRSGSHRPPQVTFA